MRRPKPQYDDPVQMGSRRWRVIRKRILERDQHTCYWCGAPATTVDHLQARSKGGLSTDANMVASCARCNYSKGNRARPKQKGGRFLRGAATIVPPLSAAPSRHAGLFRTLPDGVKPNPFKRGNNE